MKSLILILLTAFCPLAFAIRSSDITGVASVVILLFITGLLVFHILFTIFVLVFLSKKWNKINKIFEEISKNIMKK